MKTMTVPVLIILLGAVTTVIVYYYYGLWGLFGLVIIFAGALLFIDRIDQTGNPGGLL